MDGIATYDLWLMVYALLTTIFASVFLSAASALSVWAKRVIVAVFAGVFAVVGLWYQGALDLSDWSRTWLVVFIGAAGIYDLLWKRVGGAIGNALLGNDDELMP